MSRHRLRALIAVCAVVFSWPGSAWAEEPRRVGIVIAVAVNLERAEAVSLAEDMAGVLRDRLLVDIVAGRDVDRRVDPEAMAGCVETTACVAEVARRLEVQEVLFLVVVRVGEQLQLETTRANAAGATQAGPTLLVDAAGDARTVFAEAARELLPGVVERPRAVVVPVDAPPAVIAPGPIPAPADRPGRRMTTGSWIAGGVAVVALGAGGVVGLLAKRKYDDCLGGGCSDAAIDAIDRGALTADILFVAAAAAAGTAVVLYLRGDRRGLDVGAAAAPGGAAVQVRGRF
ncbi:MAG TPA: hypothetical protein VML75_24130 [Kofleriaceae bacterium]|nr:hypothetical protein [Kofleriaceae bacterium]